MAGTASREYVKAWSIKSSLRRLSRCQIAFIGRRLSLMSDTKSKAKPKSDC
ncbi:MAG: hypothetical protein FWG90_09150 [Oscillospiraceae bacterium]|nr:hypothetical protein [Oscillospiraceae bacterium]